MTPAPTRDQLAATLQSSAQPNDKGWCIYRYLKDNIGPGLLSSSETRSLLLEYTRLAVSRPSLLHSLMLGLAIKMAEVYPDFKLPAYVAMWDVRNLRAEDHQSQTDPQGRAFRPLAQRLAGAMLRYLTSHPDERADEPTMALVTEQGALAGFLPITPMLAIKVFESTGREGHPRPGQQTQGRKIRMVKLVAADGTELAAEARVFHEKPWEIVGRVFQVLPRRAEKSGNVRIDAIGPSRESAETLFGSVIGFVDSYDDKHRHYHIFDNQSRHFVAEAPKMRLGLGDYVWFAPVVPKVDPFKSAIVLAVEDRVKGREAFGSVKATIDYVNTDKGYFAYTGADGSHGYGRLRPGLPPLLPGKSVNLTVYLRRGPDGQKRPTAADAY